MKRYRWLAALGTALVLTLLWPGPAPSAGADTTLGGYTAVAYASVLHAQVYEPTIPIPADPQGDISVGYSKSTLDTGPSTRATASYLWPGDTVGDGFDQLVGQPGASYPVQVNSRFPATDTAPAKNAAQFTDGNGMATSTDGENTKASVTLLGLAGPDTNLLGGVLTGVDQLLGKKPSVTPTSPVAPAPLPVSAALAGLVTAQHVTSSATLQLGAKTVTSTAHAAASNIALLGGLISIDGVDVTSTVVSDGTKATATGAAKVAGVTIAGIKLGLSDQGLDLGAGAVKLPVLSDTVTNALQLLGISVATMPVKQKIDGAGGEFSAQVLVITVDTRPLKSALNGPLGAIVSLLPKDSQAQLSILLNLGPKLVLTVGDVDATATAAPAYTGDGGTGGGSAGGTGGSGGGSAAGGSGGGTPGGVTGPASGGGPLLAPGSTAPTVPGVVSTATNPTMQPAALHLPPLGTVPRMLVLGGLALVAVIGWAIRALGAALLGGAGGCSYGLSTGVPDLRKG